jgi:UDPglucose 6-dehydrogenase
VKDKVLALWGLSFKANTDDIRDSAALEIIRYLTALGMKVRAYDPAAGDNAQKALAADPLVEVSDNQYKIINGADALAIATDWNQFRNPNFNMIKKNLKEPVIFDGRNLYSSKQMSQLGFSYFGVGRQSVG